MAPVDDSDFPEEAELQIDYGLDRVVVVDNLPQIDSSKLEKLNNVLIKLFGQIGTVTQKDIVMPFDEKNVSKGVAFIEFAESKLARAAVEAINGHSLDKSHILRVNLLPDTERIMTVPEEFVEPEVRQFHELLDLGYWMHDERGREMYLTFADESGVYWHDAPQAEKVYGRKAWTDRRHDFSPKGSYIVTYHRPGVGLWGGPQWERLYRYPHFQVDCVDFSPCENYLVTMSKCVETGPGGRPVTSETEQTVIIWEINTAKKLREFKIESKTTTWPIFKWSHDDKYFARMTDGAVSVYTAPEMALLDKKSFKYPGLTDFSWSPSQNVMAVFLPEQGEAPAKVLLVEVPSRKELRQKNLFNVKDVQMTWQLNGEYLCVKVDRLSKSKKTVFSSFEFFRVKERDVPIEVLEIKGDVHAFGMEPRGHRFCVAHGEVPRVDVSFYSLKAAAPQPTAAKGKGKKAAVAAPVAQIDKITHLRTLEKLPVNQIYWAPANGFIVLAGLQTLNGKLLFYNLNSFEMMAEEEHFLCTDVEWDPSGRYVASYISDWKKKMENGYSIWSFSGKLLTRVAVEKFYQFIWRPRPQPLLSATKLKDIAKNLETYSKKYSAEDEKLKNALDYEAAAGRRKVRAAFMEGEARRQQFYKERAAQRAALRGGVPDEASESDFVLEEKIFEETLEIKEEIVKD